MSFFKALWDKLPTVFMRTVEKDHTELVIEKAEDVFRGLVNRSPVRTGRFRASWRMAHSSPDLTGEPEVVGWKEGMAPLAAPKVPKLSGVPKNPIIYITNSTPYGKYLDVGSTARGPLNMVKLSIQDVR